MSVESEDLLRDVLCEDPQLPGGQEVLRGGEDGPAVPPAPPAARGVARVVAVAVLQQSPCSQVPCSADQLVPRLQQVVHLPRHQGVGHQDGRPHVHVVHPDPATPGGEEALRQPGDGAADCPPGVRQVPGIAVNILRGAGQSSHRLLFQEIHSFGLELVIAIVIRVGECL